MSARRYCHGPGGEWSVMTGHAERSLARVEKKFGPQREITRDEYRRLRRNRLARLRRAKRQEAG